MVSIVQVTTQKWKFFFQPALNVVLFLQHAPPKWRFVIVIQPALITLFSCLWVNDHARMRAMSSSLPNDPRHAEVKGINESTTGDRRDTVWLDGVLYGRLWLRPPASSHLQQHNWLIQSVYAWPVPNAVLEKFQKHGNHNTIVKDMCQTSC